MERHDDVLDYARLLDQARMLDPLMLVERAGWSERVIREAADRNLAAYFFDGSRLSDGRCPAIAAALDSALTLIVGADRRAGDTRRSPRDDSAHRTCR